jgi:uncharacterized protein (TIGR03435 family)
MPRNTLALLVLALPLFAQRAAAPAFEVATIKQDEQISVEDVVSGKARLGATIDASQMSLRYASLASIIIRAYRIQTYQLTAPDWTRTQPYFDILAKIPEGNTKEQVPEMLQTLLRDRFKLAVHRDTKDIPAYVLLVGKNGPKLKEAAAGAPPAFRMTTRPGGVFHFEMTSSMPDFAQALVTYVGRPVFDRTDLKGRYEIAMDVTRENPQDNPGAAPAPQSQGTEFVSAVEQLGLKLDARKEPVEMIVVDHVEKIPTEN